MLFISINRFHSSTRIDDNTMLSLADDAEVVLNDYCSLFARSGGEKGSGKFKSSTRCRSREIHSAFACEWDTSRSLSLSAHE